MPHIFYTLFYIAYDTIITGILIILLYTEWSKRTLHFQNGTENKFRLFRASLLHQTIRDTLKMLCRTCRVNLLGIAAARYSYF
jgi:hypothetical protein